MRGLATISRRLPGASIAHRCVAAARRFLRDRRGNVLMLTGFALIPVTFATGMVIDYSRAARLQTKLNAAADAAALSTTTKPMMDRSMADACNRARTTFLNALEQSKAGLILDDTTTPTVTIKESYASAGDVTYTCAKSMVATPSLFTAPTIRNTTVSYAAQSTNAFGGVLKQGAIEIGGLGTARSSVGAYYQIVFLVDVSSSMAIGGTSSDIGKLAGDPTITCSFACHDPNGLISVSASDWCDGHPLDSFCRTNRNYCPVGKCANINPSRTYSDRSTLARLYGYKLKIDYVKDALNSFMTKLKPKMDAKPANFNVGLYTFGSEFREAQTLTNSSTDVQTAINAVEIEVAKRYNPSNANQGWTYTSVGLQSALNKLTNVGDGSGPTRRTTYIIFLSDGVEDDLGTIIYNRGTYYNYAAKCEAIKSAGATMFSIETAYPVVTDDGDGQYRKLVTELPSRNGGKTIADVMKGCASSPSRYFWADDGPGIGNAVDTVFKTIDAETSRLSQ